MNTLHLIIFNSCFLLELFFLNFYLHCEIVRLNYIFSYYLPNHKSEFSYFFMWNN